MGSTSLGVHMTRDQDDRVCVYMGDTEPYDYMIGARDQSDKSIE